LSGLRGKNLYDENGLVFEIFVFWFDRL